MEKIYRGANARITFEMTMIQLCTPQLDTSAEALLRRIDALERKAIAQPQLPLYRRKTMVLQHSK
ncbi:MAG: hypothetical protein ACLTE2_04785 [Eubacteriales bacterium]